MPDHNKGFCSPSIRDLVFPHQAHILEKDSVSCFQPLFSDTDIIGSRVPLLVLLYHLLSQPVHPPQSVAQLLGILPMGTMAPKSLFHPKAQVYGPPRLSPKHEEVRTGSHGIILCRIVSVNQVSYMLAPQCFLLLRQCPQHV